MPISFSMMTEDTGVVWGVGEGVEQKFSWKTAMAEGDLGGYSHFKFVTVNIKRDSASELDGPSDKEKVRKDDIPIEIAPSKSLL